MGGYANDRVWSDAYIPEIKRIVGPHLLSITPDEIDCKQAADLMVFTARDMKIAARVRRHGYADRYPYQFTIRSHRDSGAETELSKITQGWGDWMFYGHAHPVDPVCVRWWLIDLNAFRHALIWRSVKSQELSNGDGTYFRAFDVRHFPNRPPILIAGSHPLSREEAA